ncbi:glycosyltransferase [Tautonia rosea]|uniref:glycosyltransferase n=1 Tax=Tautonia rosea TaxID=2728037 RepID=UPI0014730610|nr:glycosyltransferase [Tautonia rosea]
MNVEAGPLIHTQADRDSSAHRPAGKRVVLVTFGSLGDLHPYIALGLELKRRGHCPVIATSEHWRSKVEAEGLPFAPVRPDAPDPDEMKAFLARLFDSRQGAKVVISELMMPALRESFEDTRRASEGADLLVAHPLTFSVRLISELDGIPWASSVLAPLSFLSSLDPPVLPIMSWLERLRWLGPRFHRALFHLGRLQTIDWVKPWHAFRAELGLPPTEENPVFEGQHAPDLVLAMFSEQLARSQADWPPQSVVTGFCLFDRHEREEATPEEVERFLDAGPPPVVFTLGSSAVWSPGQFYAESLEAIRRVGTRAILLIGPEGANALPESLPDGVAAFGYAPYSKLFPRCAAIVHQGGVGTTAQAMRAGRPMIVVPFGFDQQDNAARVQRLGIARVIPKERYTAGRVTEALRQLLDHPAPAERSAEIGRLVRQEDGPALASDAIEALLARHSSSPKTGQAPGDPSRTIQD